MGYGSCSSSRWERRVTDGDSNRRWTPADHMRWLLQSYMVIERKVPFYSGRSAIAHKRRAKSSDPGRPRRKPAEISTGRDKAVRRHERCTRLAIGQPRRACAWQGPLAFCIREYHGTQKFVSNFATLRVPFPHDGRTPRRRSRCGVPENSRSPWGRVQRSHQSTGAPAIGQSLRLSGDKTKAKIAYQDFLTLWKRRRPYIPS
jgi:hypothetical protein